ncbi:MAG: tetratricopeptide repeat protein [Verrucomicrobiota bacterium]
MSENPSSPFRMLRWAGVVVCSAALSGPLARGAATDPPPSAQETTPDNLTASGLISQGRAAFEASDFEKAEKLLDQLVADYGENPEVAPYVDEIRPLLAMCKVKRGDFEAAITLIGQSLKHPGLPAAAREELSFWRGICLLRTGDTRGAQEAFGAYYAEPAHDRTRRFEAFLLFGTGYLQLEDYPAAADFFADQIPKLPPDQKEVAGRARVLLLHSLMEAGRTDEALTIVRGSFAGLSGMTQVVSFQLLTLQLGAEFLENEKWYQAIACLNRLWPRARLLEHQHARQTEWQARRDLLKKEGAKREALVFQIDGILARISRELEQFEKIESYDAARQLRLAQAFMGLQRWREAGALLESAVAGLPPDKLLQNAAQTELASWQQIPRWDKVLEATIRFPERFQTAPDAPEIPPLRLARAEALHGLNRTEEAERAYGDLAEDFPDHKLASRSFFMGGICQMELDRPEAAVVTFRQLRERYSKSPLRADALYWEGMALTFQKQWPAARDVLASYLKTHPSGSNASDAVFERARCLHNQLQHEAAAREFAGFLNDHPDHPRVAEATLLLGESLMASGNMDEGLIILRKVPESADRMFEEAQFKIGEGLRRLERPEAERDHFARFINSHPRSLRLAEAVLQQGKAAAKAGDPDAARILYWATLESLGDDPASQGVEDLLLATRRLYSGGEGIARLMEKLDTLHREARAAGRKTMAVRALWARGHLLRESSPDQARVVFMQLGDLLDPAIHHPRLLADCADARREAGAPRTARDLYEALRKWHPRAIEKERASYGLGMLALAAGQPDEALLWFERSGHEAVGGTAGGDAMIEQAILLRSAGKWDDATNLLEKVTTSRLAQHRQKARALLELGRCALAQANPAGAARHFERCYLSGAKFREFAAPAWLEHGLVLESINKPEEAAIVYRALLAKRDFATTPPAIQARERLKSLTGGKS